MTKGRSVVEGAPILCLIDGTALAYRSYYAFVRRPLIDSRGRNVGAVYGFASSLIKLLEELEPGFIAVAFDTPEPTFRHEAYEAYKATREEMPDEMVDQLDEIRHVVEAFRIPILEIPGYEADDVIGTLATKARAAGIASVIVSSDKDFYQLVSDCVTVYDPMKSASYAIGGVEETFGVAPDKVIEVLGLMGDSSDNVPGVPGIGKKTATELIRRYGSIEGVLEHIDEISGPKRRESLEAYGDQALESRELVTIDVDSPVDLDEDVLRRHPPDAQVLADLFRGLEFPSLLERILPAVADDECQDRVAADPGDLESLVSQVRGSAGFALDVQATSSDPLSADILGIALATDSERATYVPVCGGRDGDSTGIGALKGLLEDPDLPKFGHDLKRACEVLAARGLELRGIGFDTKIASYLLDPDRRQHGLNVLAPEHLDRRLLYAGDTSKGGDGQLPLEGLSQEEAGRRSRERVDAVLALVPVLTALVHERGVDRVLREVELPLVPLLAAMEARGIVLDVELIERLGLDLERQIGSVRDAACSLAGTEFNLGSPKQVGDVLFERLELPRGRRTKTGYSTDTRVLSKLAESHEIAGLILKHRQLTKLKTGYLDALPKLVNPRTGRLHTSFNQTVASTGRLSSSNPNLQSIPMRTDLGREIRRAFVAEEGRRLLSADYSQIELRIMAHLSQDANLMDAMTAGKDFHRSTAALVFGEDEERIDQTQRDWAKSINFGIMYGMSPYGLARELGVSDSEAAEFIERYFDTYPGVREYTERAISDAERTGYAATILGRKRAIRGFSSGNPSVRALAERAAVNTPIQGSAADLIKLAMIGVDRRIRADGLPCDMVLQVHDELVFETTRGDAERVADAVRDEMEGVVGLAVPLRVDVGAGENWAEAH